MGKSKRIMALTMIMVLLVSSIQIYAVEKTTALVLSYEGDVSIKKLGAEKNYTPVVNMELAEGSTIITGKDSEITLLLNDDKEVIVGEKSYVSLEELRTVNGRETTGLRIFSGSIWSSIKKKLGFGDKYEIRTPNSIMGARGTKYIVSFENEEEGQEAQSELIVVEGTVRATSDESESKNQDELFVDAGYSTRVTGKTPINNEDAPSEVKKIDSSELDLFSVNRILEDMDKNPDDYTNSHLQLEDLQEKQIQLKEKKRIEDMNIKDDGDSSDDDDKDSSSTDGIVDVKSVQVNSQTSKFKIGQSIQLEVDILPSSATYPIVTWKSSDKDVATVDSSGLVEAISKGHASITATSVVGSVSGSIELEVEGLAVSGIILSDDTISLYKDEFQLLTQQIIPSAAANQKVKWESDDELIASVDSNGLVQAKKLGSTTIHVTSDDGSFTDSCTVNVVKAIVSVDGLALSDSVLNLYLGDTEYLTPAISPANATNHEVDWDSSDKSVAVVDFSGKIESLAVGTTTISAISVDGGKEATCTVNVLKIPVTEFQILESNVGLNTTDKTSKQLTYFINPGNATDNTITWTSSDGSVASVADGLVTVVGPGTTTITGIVDGTSFEDACDISVDFPVVNVDSVEITPTLSLLPNEFKTVTVTINPAGATNQNMTITSDAPDIASVDNAGLVHGIKAGSATITVVTEDGNKTDLCQVTVAAIEVEEILVTEPSIAMTVGDTKSLNVQITPTNATNQKLTYSLDVENIVSIDSDGVITAESAGEVVITVESEDGGFTSTATVEVNNPIVDVTGVEASPITETVYVGDELDLVYQVNPVDASNQNVTFVSSHPAIAQVDATGHVTAIGEGLATITVETQESGYEAQVQIEVLEVVEVIPTSVSITADAFVINVGDYLDLTPVFVPANTTNHTVYWNSDDESVATVDSNGQLHAKKVGVVEIRVTTQSGGKQALLYVAVVQPVSSAYIDDIKMYDDNIDGYLDKILIDTYTYITFYDYFKEFTVTNLGDINEQFDHAIINNDKITVYLDNSTFSTGGFGFNDIPANQLIYSYDYGSLAGNYEFEDRARPVPKAFEESYDPINNSSSSLKILFSEDVDYDLRDNEGSKVIVGDGSIVGTTENSASTYTLELSGFTVDDEIRITDKHKDSENQDSIRSLFRLVGDPGEEYWMKVAED